MFFFIQNNLNFIAFYKKATKLGKLVYVFVSILGFRARHTHLIISVRTKYKLRPIRNGSEYIHTVKCLISYVQRLVKVIAKEEGS